MRLVIQRTKEASVVVDGEVVGSIGQGLFVLVGVEDGDTEADMGHELAIALYDKYCERLSAVSGIPVEKGVFGANMQCSLVNDGPVTIIIDSRIRE